MNGDLLQLALREMRGVFTSGVSRFALLIAIFVLTVSGPFGTFQSLGLGQRLAYWAVVVLASYAVGQGVASALLEGLKHWIPQRWPRAIIAAILAALPITAIVFIVNSVVYQRLDWTILFNLWLYTSLATLVVVAAMVALSDRLQRAAVAAPPAEGAGNSQEPPPILERVPLPQRGKLLALIVEDHYVDIVTDRGKTLVLMRLADAIRETGTIAGLQIHRSHWVARDGVIKAHRSEGKLSLELSNGLRLPVSRGYAAAVKEARLA